MNKKILLLLLSGAIMVTLVRCPSEEKDDTVNMAAIALALSASNSTTNNTTTTNECDTSTKDKVTFTNNHASARTLSVKPSGNCPAGAEVANTGSIASGASASVCLTPVTGGYEVQVEGDAFCNSPTGVGDAAGTTACSIDTGGTISCP